MKTVLERIRAHRPALQKAARALPVVLIPVLLAVFLVRSLQASRRLAALETVSALACDKPSGRVLVAARGQVWILGEDGRTLGHLRDAGGARAALSGVSSIAVATGGGVWVVEPPRHAVHRFAPDGSFDRTVVEGPEHARRMATVLPLAGGGFALADTIGHALRVFDGGGVLLAERELSYPNDFLGIEGGFVLVETGMSRVRAFDRRLDPLPVPERLAELPLAPTVFELDADSSGALYFNTCPKETECEVLRVRDGKARVAAADLWLAGYDPRDPSFGFCVTSDGRVLTASQTFDAVVEYTGAHDADSPAPSELSRAAVADGLDTGSGLRIGLFGDDAFRAWIAEGWEERRALATRVTQGRTGLGALLALLLVTYSAQRLLGHPEGVQMEGARRVELYSGRCTGERLRALWRRVVRPDLAATARAALPSFAVALVLLLLVLPLAAWLGPIELLVILLLSNRLLRRLAPVEKIAAARSEASARHAFELQVGGEASRAFPDVPSVHPEAASFAAPARVEKGDKALDNPNLEPDVGALDADAFELVDLLEGRSHLVAFCGRRIIWYPCNFTGRPTGPLRVAKPLACSLPADFGDRVELPGLRFSGVRPALAGRLSARPILGPVIKLCEECGRRLSAEVVPPEAGKRTDVRCEHYRDVGKPALTLTALLPGLGHLLLRKYRRGRWLAFAAVLLLGRLLYVALPMTMGTLPVDPLRLFVPILLYALLWWKSLREVREQSRARQ